MKAMGARLRFLAAAAMSLLALAGEVANDAPATDLLAPGPIVFGPAMRPGGAITYGATGLCDVRDFGVRAGVGEQTRAIQAALDECARLQKLAWFPAPKGRKASYESGALWLRSRSGIYLDEGATLQGTHNKSSELWPDTWKRREGTMVFTKASLVNAGRCESIQYDPVKLGDQCRKWRKVSDVVIAGPGTIDGGGDSGWYSRNGAVDKTVPRYHDRPTLLSLFWADGLTVRDVHLRNSPFWVLHPAFSRNVYITNVTIASFGRNSDGIDPDSCENVIIENSSIATEDDCIAIKSGKDADGWAVGLPSRNITVRNVVASAGRGVAIGSETSGDILDVTVRNVTFHNTEWGVRVKSQRGRGGLVAGISFEGLEMHEVGTAIKVSQIYSGFDEGPAPTFRDITIRDVHGSAQNVGEVRCLGQDSCTGIRLERIELGDGRFRCRGPPEDEGSYVRCS